MTSTYSEHAAICAKFYELTLDDRQVADFIVHKIRAEPKQKALFVGGMFQVAGELPRWELELSVVDYTDEMVAIGREQLPKARVLKADLRDLPFVSEFDLVFVIGRVFTHMTTDPDLKQAIQSCKRALKPGGKILADNYESSKIQVTNYFNGEVRCGTQDTLIVRKSTTSLISADPFVVRWDADYSGSFNDKDFHFTDTMEHRAFSRQEFAGRLREAGLEVIEQDDNFDETSFYTLAVNTMR